MTVSGRFHSNVDIFRLGSRLNVCRWMFRNDRAAEWDIESVGLICKRMQVGHAGKDMSDLYDKIKEDIQFRREWAERSGFGFELPSVVPNVPKTAEKAEAQKAA